MGRSFLNSYGKRPKQTVRTSPGKGAGPEEVPQRKDRAEEGPKALNSFTHLKNCPDFVSICKMLGSIQECIHIHPQKAFILRGQRILLSWGPWGVSFP